MAPRNKIEQVDQMIYYMNNPNLKASNVKLTYTEEQIKEYIKCSQDPIYFIENYIKIVTVDHGLSPFNMWDFQKNLIDAFQNHRYVICKIARQSGKSTTTVSYILWLVLFRPMQRIAILANQSSAARETLSRLQVAYEYLPLWMQQGIKAWNKGSIELENGSRIMAGSTTENSVRGQTYNLILLDEFAHVPYNIAEEFITSVYPTISSGKTSQVIMISTPKGMNLFYKFWTDAVNKKNLYFPVEVHFTSVPGRESREWQEEQIKQLGQEKFDQEFSCNFLGSSDTLIATSKLSSIPWQDPIVSRNHLQVYELPKHEGSYIITVDTARGQNSDYSAFSVIDTTNVPYRQVAKFRDDEVSPMIYPNIIHNVAKNYNNAFILVETNDLGQQVADILFYDLEYENIFCTVTMGRGGQKLTMGKIKNGRLGVKTTGPMKSVGCSNLKTLIESDQLILKDFDTISELTTFVLKNKSYEAEEGRNDDLAITLVLFAWLCAQPMFKQMTDTNIQKIIFQERENSLNETMLPFGAYINNSEDERETFVDESGTVWEEFDPKIVKESKWWNVFNYTLEDEEEP